MSNSQSVLGDGSLYPVAAFGDRLVWLIFIVASYAHIEALIRHPPSRTRPVGLMTASSETLRLGRRKNQQRTR
ncbi:hypothetical protein AXG89_29660 (plasmid) [Burkholderia sp. PAMC 26561]|nr:hypothetical protein AXG89_23020 [Burkholderia sp. PAMC 26561]AME27989.1 hypothetical protein AXG89_29660 [Burkholderia sp. PAMC 26561]